MCTVGERHGLESASGWYRECSERIQILEYWRCPEIRSTCVRYSLLADSLPRWYLPEESGQGGDAVGEGGRQGLEGGYAGASQPARLASQHSVQCPVPSAQCRASANAIRAFLFLCPRFI